MASFWNNGLKISIFGESYSKAIGVVVDNFPAGIKISFSEIEKDLINRSPLKKRAGTTKRKEKDEFEVLSGIYNGFSTGTPISCVILNSFKDSSSYYEIKNLIRPSHADYGGAIRYNFFNNPKGGGHFSGRLTAAFVFAGSLCKQALRTKGIKTYAHILSVGSVKDLDFQSKDFKFLELENLKEKEISVLNDEKIKDFVNEIENVEKEGNSIGGVVECGVFGVPAGIGSPIFDGIENFVAQIVFSIPAVKGLEFGKGFEFGYMTGFSANDEFYIEDDVIKTKTNNNGGILGGISTGMPIIFKVVFKPTPTIFKKQNSVNLKTKQNQSIICKGNHDSCIAVRGVFVVEAAANVAILSQLVFQGKF